MTKEIRLRITDGTPVQSSGLNRIWNDNAYRLGLAYSIIALLPSTQIIPMENYVVSDIPSYFNLVVIPTALACVIEGQIQKSKMAKVFGTASGYCFNIDPKQDNINNFYNKNFRKLCVYDLAEYGLMTSALLASVLFQVASETQPINNLAMLFTNTAVGSFIVKNAHYYRSRKVMSNKWTIEKAPREPVREAPSSMVQNLLDRVRYGFRKPQLAPIPARTPPPNHAHDM